MKAVRYFSYIFLTVWKVLLFFICMLCIDWIFVGSVNHLFDYFYDSFHEHPYNVTEIQLPDQGTRMTSTVAGSTGQVTQTETLIAWPNTAAYVFCIQAGTALACFLAGKFACKIRIQAIGFALPINLTVPTTITLLITFCGLRMGNPCYFSDVIPPHLFFECPDGGYLLATLTNQHAWAWVFWLISQAWITSHNWTPKCGRLATTEKLFVYPFYNAFLVDQSLAMNRRRDDDVEVETEELKQIDSTDVELSQKYGYDKNQETSSDSDSGSSISGDSLAKKVNPTDYITRIYTCATMWHENAEETVTFLKSIFYLDDDQCARRLAQQYLKVLF
jgi:chitin synthase